MKAYLHKITWLTIFSIAMGFMETAVVIYMRKLYYPGGFSFPLIPIDMNIALIEFLREAATIIMLAGIGILAGRTSAQKFAFFIYCFAIWDLFYYVFLKLFINWPASFFTWDILFLIPVPWLGPVLAPCIISITMILLAFTIIYFDIKDCNTSLIQKEWLLFITGCLIVLFSFMQNYCGYIVTEPNSNNILTLSGSGSLFTNICKYVPTTYNWGAFIIGEVIILCSLFLFAIRMKKLNDSIK